MKIHTRVLSSISLLVVGGTVIAGLSGCTASSSKETIRISSPYADLWSAPFKKAATDYEKAHPGVSVEVDGIPYKDYQSAYQTQLVGGSAPDIMMVEPPAAADFAGRGFLAPLDKDLAADSSWKSHYADGALSAVRGADGKQYLAPWSSVSVLLAYHKDLYQKAGVSAAPTSWDAWMADNRKLKAAGLQPFDISLKGDDATAWWLLVNKLNAVFRPLTAQINLKHKSGFAYKANDLNSTVGETYTTDELYVAFKKGLIDPAKSPAYKAAVQITAQIIPYLNSDSGSAVVSDINAKFANSTNPQIVGVGATLAGVATTIEKTGAKSDITTVDLPSITKSDYSGLTDGGENPLSGPRNGFVINKASKNVKTALDFVKFISTPKEATRLYAVNPQGDPSLIKGVTYPSDSVITSSSPQKFAEINAYGFGGAPTFDAQDADQFNSQWQQFLTGNISLDSFLAARSASNLAALTRNLALNPASVDQSFIKSQLGE